MIQRYNMGEIVFATEDIANDGFIPDVAPDALLAAVGTRGVVVQIGFTEANEDVEIYLVRFEGDNQVLGPPVGCLVEELTQDEAAAKRLAA
jgi:nitrogen fixation protein NifZ